MWNLYVESLCGMLGNLNLCAISGMWNVLRVEPLMRNLGAPGSSFSAAAPNHPEALLARPLSFSAVGEK